jgi:hypothetical protein
MRSATRAPPGCPLRSASPPPAAALRSPRPDTARRRVGVGDFGEQMNWSTTQGVMVMDPYGMKGIFPLRDLIMMLHCRHIKTTLTVTNSQLSVGYLTTTFYDSSGYLYVTNKNLPSYIV